MGTYLSPSFYAAVCLLYCGLQWQPTRLKRGTWFGVLNVVALSMIFGLKVGFLVVAFTIALWLPLHVLHSLPSGSIRRSIEIAVYAAVTLAFIFHKLTPAWILAEPSTPSTVARGAQIVTGFFETIAYSYVYLRALDTIRAVSAGAEVLNPASLSGYLVPFFMLPAGPVNVYADHTKIDREELPEPTWTNFIACIDTVTSGLFLKFVVAEIWKLYFIGLDPLWPTETFLDTAVIFVYVYFDFFGYSLVALGIGRLLGVPTPINFKAPFLSISMTEFWTRWHISLGDFVRRDLFIPIQVAMVRRFGRRWAYATNVIASANHLFWICWALASLYPNICHLGACYWGYCPSV